MRRFLSGLTTLVALVGLAAVAAAADDWEQCKLRGTPDLRMAACTRIIEKGGEQKKVALAYAYRGSAYNSKGEKDLAIADYNEAIRRDPTRAAAFRGLVHLANGDRDSAIAEFDEAIRKDPNDALPYNVRGSSYNAKGERDSAIADLNKAIELDPKFALAYYNRGIAYGAKGEIDQAAKDFNKAIELDPNFAVAYNGRGTAFYRRSDYGQAIADFSKAIEHDPKYADAYRMRGLAYGAKGEVAQALADCSKAIELNPKFALAYNARGYIYSVKGEVDQAIADYSTAVELDPKFALAFHNRGLTYERKGDQERAVADYRKVLELPAPSTTDQQRQEIARQRIARVTQVQRGLTVPPAPQRVALVMGNSNYLVAGVLPNPKNDAHATAAALRRLGFSEVIELYDLTREKMGQAIKEFGDRAEGAEWAVVFYAGHGLEMGGVNYLIPTDAKLVRDTHVADETVSLTSVQTKVDGATKIGLVILDSCRNNPFLSRMVRTGAAGTSRSVSRGLAIIEPEGNILVIYSAKHGTTAEDGSGEHSPFTEALLRNIEEPGLEINFLFRKVRDEVRAKTERRQEPFLYGSLSSELLYFKAPSAR
jgi:tetratricopeptide (TPR) repeat protein